MLRRTRLTVQGGQLRLTVPAAVRPSLGEAVDRRLDALARAFERKPIIKSA